MPATVPPELQKAINAAAFPIMQMLKMRGPLTVVLDPPPAPPAGLTATASLNGIALVWTANTEPDLAASPYRVYRNGALLAGPQSGTSYADPSAHAGTQYAYTVTASDAAGNESAPAAATATRPAPPAVTKLTAAPTTGHDVALSWQASTDPAHAGYPLFRSANGGAFTLLATPTLTTYTDPAPPQNVALVYRIFDQNNIGDSGPNADVSALIDTAAPAALTNLRVTGETSTSISLAWDASSAPDLAGYKIERSVSGAAFTTLAALQSATTFVDSGVSSGFPYTYRVSAVDTSNNVGQGATITVSIPLPPAAPTNLTATASTSGIALTWSALAGAASYRASSSQSATGTFVPIGPPSTNSYNDTAAVVGTTTYYRVWAVDSLSQQGSIASVSAVRPAPGGVGFPRVGVGASVQTAAVATAPKLGHFTHFSAYHLVTSGDWKDKRLQWDLGESGTQTVIDPRDGITVVDLGTQQEGPHVVFAYTTAGVKNVSVTITNEDSTQQKFSCVVNVPPAGRTVNLVGPARTFKTFADISAHAADNTEWVLDAGTYFTSTDVRMKRNMVVRAAVNGTVSIHRSGSTLSTTGSPTGGAFTWDVTTTVSGVSTTRTTAPIAFNASASAIQSAIMALSNVGAGKVTATGGPLPAGVALDFMALQAGVSMAMHGNGLTGGTAPNVQAATSGSIFTYWPGQSADATVIGIAGDSDYWSTVNGDGTPYKLSLTTLAHCYGENIGFIDCTVAVMDECWKGSEITNLMTGAANLNGMACLRCAATDPIGVRSRTFWIEGNSVAVVGCTTLNSMTESPMRNANTSADYPYVAWTDVRQTLDPANHRTGAKAAATFRAMRHGNVTRNKFSGSDLSFDPHTGAAFDSDNLIDSNLVSGQITVQGNNVNVKFVNNVMDRRGANQTGIYLSFNGNLPINGLEIVNNTFIGNTPHTSIVYVGTYTGVQLTGLVIANNLHVNPALVPIAGNSFSNSVVFSQQDIPGVTFIGGNVHPNVNDSKGGKKLIYVGGTTLSPDYMLTLAQFNPLYSAADVQLAVTLNAGYAPAATGFVATGGARTSSVVKMPLLDYYGQPRAAGSVGAVNPV